MEQQWRSPPPTGGRGSPVPHAAARGPYPREWADPWAGGRPNIGTPTAPPGDARRAAAGAPTAQTWPPPQRHAVACTSPVRRGGGSPPLAGLRAGVPVPAGGPPVSAVTGVQRAIERQQYAALPLPPPTTPPGGGASSLAPALPGDPRDPHATPAALNETARAIAQLQSHLDGLQGELMASRDLRDKEASERSSLRAELQLARDELRREQADRRALQQQLPLTADAAPPRWQQTPETGDPLHDRLTSVRQQASAARPSAPEMEHFLSEIAALTKGIEERAGDQAGKKIEDLEREVVAERTRAAAAESAAEELRRRVVELEQQLREVGDQHDVCPPLPAMPDAAAVVLARSASRQSGAAADAEARASAAAADAAHARADAEQARAALEEMAAVAEQQRGAAAEAEAAAAQTRALCARLSVMLQEAEGRREIAAHFSSCAQQLSGGPASSGRLRSPNTTMPHAVPMATPNATMGGMDIDVKEVTWAGVPGIMPTPMCEAVEAPRRAPDDYHALCARLAVMLQEEEARRDLTLGGRQEGEAALIAELDALRARLYCLIFRAPEDPTPASS